MMTEQLSFFQYLLGNGNSPHQFQLEPAKYLYDGIPTILSAPTGSGKTLAAIFPFLYAKKNNNIFADRMFYVLPQRTLVRSIYSDVSKKIHELGLPLHVTMQMGDQPDDPKFQGDIIFTTIDQLLSNYIGASLSVSKGQSNIPPGAFAGAYFVFDEIHAVPKESLPTILDMVRRFRSFARFLLMTATIPTPVIVEIEQRIGGSRIQVSEKDLTHEAKRILYWKQEPLDTKQIIHYHMQQDGIRKTIVVVNRVERSQQFYFDVKKIIEEQNLPDDIYLLHSRFLSTDRKGIEQEVIASLGKNLKNNDKNTIVIATQVIEIGLDLSAKILLTELAPANAIIQRAGRCARFIGEHGDVYVFDLPHKTNGQIDTSPYFNKDKILLEKTRTYLMEKKSFSMNLKKEVEFVDEIHQEIELKLLQSVSTATAKREVLKNLESGDFSGIRRMVRDINNISVIIHDRPELLDMTLIPERFSVHSSTISKVLNDASAFHNKVWGYRVITNEDDQEESQWKTIFDKDEIVQYSIIAIHSDLATYIEDLGLIFDSLHQFRISNKNYQAKYLLEHPREIHPQYHYKKETYAEHVSNIRILLQKQIEMNKCALIYFSDYYNVTLEDIEQLIEIAVAFHDTGKLNESIQQNYKDWQKKRRKEVVTDYLAHTDYEPTNNYDFIEWKTQKRIPHAIEGAYISYPTIEKRIENITNDDQKQRQLCNGIFTAIARHHHSYASTLRSNGKLIKDAKTALASTLSGLGLSSISNSHMNWKCSINLNPYWIKASDEGAWIWYWFVVRNLRLADHLSQQSNQIEEVNS